jgi:hypothetical protein
MEILLLIAVVAVGAAGLYVAYNFNRITRQNFSLAMTDAADSIYKEISASSEHLHHKTQEITEGIDRLQAAQHKISEQIAANAEQLRDYKSLLDELRTASGDLQQQTRVAVTEARQKSERVERLSEQSGARYEQISDELEKLRRRAAELSESLTDQSGRISKIYRQIIPQQAPAGSSSEENSLCLAMLEAESYVDDQGWDGRLHLYALTDGLVLTERESLPDGDLVTALASVHWPRDVVGCVMITELASLSARGLDGSFSDPAADGWTSPHPDGRVARLAIAVLRSGEHAGGLRIKGADTVQVRTDLAGELTAALLRTF